jgi:hypothetical protein
MNLRDFASSRIRGLIRSPAMLRRRFPYFDSETLAISERVLP